MTDNLEFWVPFTIEGGVWVSKDKASDPDEAKAYVDRQYGAQELAEMGCLETFAGEERPKKRVSFRDAYMEQLRQDLGEEQRHG